MESSLFSCGWFVKEKGTSEEGLVTVIPLSSKIDNISSPDSLIIFNGTTHCAEISRIHQIPYADVFSYIGKLDKEQFNVLGTVILEHVERIGEKELSTPMIRVIC